MVWMRRGFKLLLLFSFQFTFPASTPSHCALHAHQVMVLTHTETPIEEQMPYHGLRSSPCRPVLFIGRSAFKQPAVHPHSCMYMFYRDRWIFIKSQTGEAIRVPEILTFLALFTDPNHMIVQYNTAPPHSRAYHMDGGDRIVTHFTLGWGSLFVLLNHEDTARPKHVRDQQDPTPSITDGRKQKAKINFAVSCALSRSPERDCAS